MRGEGGERTVDLAFVDERRLIDKLLVVGDKVVERPAHLVSALVSVCAGCGERRRRGGAYQTTCKQIEDAAEVENEVENV